MNINKKKKKREFIKPNFFFTPSILHMKYTIDKIYF